MQVKIRTTLAYALIALGFLLTLPWCAAVAWVMFLGAERLGGLLWAFA